MLSRQKFVEMDLIIRECAKELNQLERIDFRPRENVLDSLDHVTENREACEPFMVIIDRHLRRVLALVRCEDIYDAAAVGMAFNERLQFYSMTTGRFEPAPGTIQA